jgi:radical SAM protein with 4Fe4S-binding SPASM domain
LNYLTNLNLDSAPNFHRIKVIYEDKDHLAISAREFADFLGTMFKVWWANRDRYGAVQPFQWYADNIIDNKISLNCEISGDCAYRWFYLGPEGEASHCGIGGDYRALSYGNIKDRSIYDILHDRQRDEMAKRQIVLAETKCKDCCFWRICHGGCPIAAYLKNGDFHHPAPSCEETTTFFEKYFEPITGIKVDLKRDSRERQEYPA